MSQAYHTGHQGPSNPAGFGPGPGGARSGPGPMPGLGGFGPGPMRPPHENYPSAEPSFGGFGPPSPPRQQSYKGYFGQQEEPYYYNHQHYGPEPLCIPFLRTCLGTLCCCCCLLEQCCFY